ncbi:hypothetical protein B7494_g4690 [Chlorociboria aeruginascens]|nr:hypothetical protein B7494_g4690 [Chlorociboria aeruginascens]
MKILESGFPDPDGGHNLQTNDAALQDYPSTTNQDAIVDTFNCQNRALDSEFKTSLAVQEVQQLPSPLPSPRSLSPSPIDKYGEKGGIFANGNGHFLSASNSASILHGTGKDTASPIFPKLLPPHELPGIPEKMRNPRRLSFNKGNGDDKVLRLTPAEMEELTSAPESLPIISPPRAFVSEQPLSAPLLDKTRSTADAARFSTPDQKNGISKSNISDKLDVVHTSRRDRRQSAEAGSRRPGFISRAVSTPPTTSNRQYSYSKGSSGQVSPKRKPVSGGLRPDLSDLDASSNGRPRTISNSERPPSPIPQPIPLPPMSIPTYLQLELSGSRPSPLYIHRSANSDTPYESSKIKFERLLNFLLLPPQLEQVLYFGSLACLDAWLYTFTILPLRFIKAIAVLVHWWGQVLAKEARFVLGFIYYGSGRMWHRQLERRDSNSFPRSASRSRGPQVSTATSNQSHSGRPSEIIHRNGNAEELKLEVERKAKQGWGRRHRRTQSHPSSLSSNHKADILQGLVIICSCIILMKLDASRMYHNIKGQSNIKLYVIYNGLEVCDRLFSALGQDIFECLFSNETLERDTDGRSKILRPLWMFVLALIYNVIHATALFYQVITLNVAVNSYSNALLTLLLSNQFVEIKSTVFKKFEKDNLFQLTCADVVERFQLWLILFIIALRNIVEFGGLSAFSSDESVTESIKNATASVQTKSILPNSFLILPSWSGEVLTPFLIVLGSEMLVDWIKHAYISKFNNVKPAVYQRFLDILAKDYYTNAFVNQNLIKRLGLPVIPLSCLSIRASVQTYHMFLATHVPAPIPSTATALSVDSATTSPATTAALEHFDNIIRKALGRSTFGIPDPKNSTPWYLPSTDDAIAALTMLIFFFGAFFVLLACKLLLGMFLLQFARNRYSTMKKREHENYDTGGKRVGGWGMVEVDDDKKRWIYDDDPETLKNLKEKEKSAREKAEKGTGQDFSKVTRLYFKNLEVSSRTGTTE